VFAAASPDSWSVPLREFEWKEAVIVHRQEGAMKWPQIRERRKSQAKCKKRGLCFGSWPRETCGCWNLKRLAFVCWQIHGLLITKPSGTRPGSTLVREVVTGSFFEINFLVDFITKRFVFVGALWCDVAGPSESQQRGGFPGDLTMEYVNSVDAILISQVHVTCNYLCIVFNPS
jgi:hypothetical protein